MMLFVVVAVVAIAICLVLRGRHPGFQAVAVTCVVIACLFLEFLSPSPKRAVSSPGVPTEGNISGMVTSKTCRKCHPGAFDSWHRTFHRTMTQRVSPEVVEAPFDGESVVLHGQSYTFYRQNGEFRVEMPEVEIPVFSPENRPNTMPATLPVRSYPIVMCTGSHHVQLYWVDAGTYLREVPIYWHIDGQRWIPKHDTTLVPPGQTTFTQIWNVKCIRCHSVAGNPNANVNSRSLNSQVSELGIACEACHGPAERHVQKHTNPLTRLQSRADDTPDATIINPAKVSAQISSEICGQCHTEFDPVDEKQFYTHGLPYRAGGNLQASHRIFRYAEITRNENDSENAMFCRTHGFWDDGTIRSGGDEYLGLLESPCYQRGTGTRQLSCLSCHQMHGSDPNDQLKETMSGNEACLQCHDQFRKRLEQHTHHPPSSAGSLCYNCHMPHTTYALFTAMRSHRIVVPKVVVGNLSGRPNACNLCHLDQTLDWTAKQLNRWYDTPIGKEAGHTVGHDDDIPASVRWVLSGDAAQRLIVAWHMGWEPALKVSGDRWQSPLLSELLIDPYSVVRHVAHRSLRSHPDFKDFEYDFIAPPAQRRETRDRAIAIWNGVVHRSPVQQLDAVFDVDGKLKLGVVKKLMEQRDEREVFLPE